MYDEEMLKKLRRLKFLISFGRKSHYEPFHIPKYNVIGEIEHSENEVKEIGGGYTEIVYGNQIVGYDEVNRKVGASGISCNFEQIPIKLFNMPIVLIKDLSSKKIITYDQFLKKSTSGSNEIVYGYKSSIKGMGDFEFFDTIEERNKAVTAILGEEYNFDNLDESYRLTPKL